MFTNTIVIYMTAELNLVLVSTASVPHNRTWNILTQTTGKIHGFHL